MQLRSIYLKNFRSYKKLNIKIDNVKFVILTGKNGIGKTNLLEAISFLSPGKGFKNSKINEIINTNSKLKQGSIFFEIENFFYDEKNYPYCKIYKLYLLSQLYHLKYIVVYYILFLIKY